MEERTQANELVPSFFMPFSNISLLRKIPKISHLSIDKYVIIIYNIIRDKKYNKYKKEKNIMERKFKGIKKAITETKKLNGFNGKVEINYNIENDVVSCKYFWEVVRYEKSPFYRN